MNIFFFSRESGVLHLIFHVTHIPSLAFLKLHGNYSKQTIKNWSLLLLDSSKQKGKFNEMIFKQYLNRS